MEPRIEEKGPFTFVGLEITTTVADNQIPELWEEFIDRMDDIADVDDVHNTFGICQYVDAESMTEDTPFNYMAAMAAAGAEDLPEGMTVRNLPKRLYAIFTHRGSLENLDETYQFIYGQWLPASDYELAPNEELEVYGEEFDPDKPNSALEIWIPLNKMEE